MRPRKQAKLTAQLQYAPESSGLRMLERELYGDLAHGLQFEEGQALALIAAAAQARKPVKRAYRQSGRERDRVYAQAGAALAGLTPAADPFRGALARELAQSVDRSTESRAQTVADLASRGVRAREGQAYASRALRSEFKTNLGKVRLRQAEIAGLKGALAAKTYAELLAAQKAANLDARKAAETERHNRASERDQRLDRRLDRRKEQRLAAKERAAARENRGPSDGERSASRELYRAINNATSTIATLRRLSPNMTTTEIRTVMAGNKTEKNPYGGFARDVINAGFDIYTQKRLSPLNAKRMRGAGLLIPKRWRPAKKKQEFDTSVFNPF